MAECLVRRIDKINKDAILCAKCTKAEDFIVIQDDDWPWGKSELDSRIYYILLLRKVFWRDIEYLVREEALPKSSPYRQKRGFSLKVGKLPARSSKLWNGNKVTLSWTKAVFDAAILVKQPLRDPNII